jgi:predicted DNA-binding transcriptional regulator AlpA
MAVQLVSISAYAEKWGIARSTVYDLIAKKVITRYESPEGEPMLNIDEHPKGVQKHGDRKRKIT